MGAEEKKPAEGEATRPRTEEQSKRFSKPRLRGAFKFKTWEEKERWEKIWRDAGLLG